MSYRDLDINTSMCIYKSHPIYTQQTALNTQTKQANFPKARTATQVNATLLLSKKSSLLDPLLARCLHSCTQERQECKLKPNPNYPTYHYFIRRFETPQEDRSALETMTRTPSLGNKAREVCGGRGGSQGLFKALKSCAEREECLRAPRSQGEGRQRDGDFRDGDFRDGDFGDGDFRKTETSERRDSGETEILERRRFQRDNFRETDFS